MDSWDTAGLDGHYPPVEAVLGLGIPRDNSGRKESQEVSGPASKPRFLRDLSSLTWKTSMDRDCVTPLGIPGTSSTLNNSHFVGAFHREFVSPVLEHPKLLLDGLGQSGIVGIVPAIGRELGMGDP